MTALCMAGAIGAAPLAAQAPSPSAVVLDSLLQTPISAASRYAQTAAEAPASMTIVTAEEIQRFGYRTLGQVLQRIPSFYLASDRNYTYVGVRGFGRPTDYNNRLLLLLNGFSMNETFYGGAFVERDFGIDLGAVERIEIVRGPASALYGSNAVFAVVNVVTTDGAQLAGTRLSVEGGDHGQADVAATFGRKLGPYSALVAANAGGSNGTDIYFPAFDDPATNDGVAHALDAEHYRNALLTVSRGGLSMQAQASSRTKGIPTASWGSTFNAPGAWTRDIATLLAAEYRRQVRPQLEWSVRGHADGYHYRGRYPSDVTEADRNVGQWAGVDGQLVWDAAPNHRMSVGGEVVHTRTARYQTQSDGATTYDRNFPFTTWGAFLSDELEVLRGVTLVSGLRFDGHSRSDDRLTPRFALIAVPDASTTLKLLWGRAFRSPSIYEREFFDDTFARSSGLTPEWIRTTEAVLERRIGSGSWATVSLFQNHVGGLIDTGEDPLTGKSQFQNLGAATARGVEVNARVAMSGGRAAYIGYSYTLAEAKNPTSRLSNSPRTQAMAGWSRAFRDGGRIAVETRFEDSRLTLSGAETRRAVLVNANLLSPPLWRGLVLTGRAVNVFNTGWDVPAGTEHVQDVIPQRSRSLFLGVRARW
ncbi:MAG: TonB-dependent receptor [Gemmatimonadetes bacterium]|nr:TonB-dependent receptor [Gemmatimonadota bacterium]